MVRLLKRGNSLDKLLRVKSSNKHHASPSSSPSPPASTSTSSRPPQGYSSGAAEGSGALSTQSGASSPSSSSSSMSMDGQPSGWAVDRHERVPKSRLGKDGATVAGGKDPVHSDMELMKERFAKLLLGEDMSGGGKGVSSALALSNAITNLAASVFGEQRRLEPMAADRKARWKKEIDWLLSVTDVIVEMVPVQQKNKDGIQMEIMTTQQRTDLHMNIPALRKLDAMLLDYLENFKDQNEFWYVKRGEDDDDGQAAPTAQRNEDKWWLPTVKVPATGLSEVSRRWLQFQKDSVNQVLKAAMAINAQVLSEMDIPEAYIDSLPKNGKTSLGDHIYRHITVESFNPEQFLSSVDLSTEHKVLDLKNRVEASVVIWKRKMHNNKDGKSSVAPWGSGVSLEKRELFEDRAETILVLLKQRFPGLPQSSLDISKIQFNKDVGQSILESYSRILESLAYNVMARIEDVLDADAAAQDPEHKRRPSSVSMEPVTGPVKFPNPEEEIKKLNSMHPPSSMTLSDFMGWHLLDQECQEQEAAVAGKKDTDSSTPTPSPEHAPKHSKLSKINTAARKFSENLGGLRSPTSRH